MALTPRMAPPPTGLDGRVALVTGAEKGIGLQAAQALAVAGAELIACSSSPSGGDDFAFDPLDLDSVERLADRVLARGRPVDIVIAAAEVAAIPFGLTREGFERQMGYNAVANAVLASCLSPALRAAEAGRFVILGSRAHQLAEPDPDDLGWQRRAYDPWLAYGASKTAAGLIALKIFDALVDEAISTCAVDPGALPGAGDAPLPALLADTSRGAAAEAIRGTDGVATLLWAASAPEAFARYCYAEDSAAARMIAQPNGTGGFMAHIGEVPLAMRLWEGIERQLGRELLFER